MNQHAHPPKDPILALLPEVRGRRILRPCVLYARLGRGGMGAVYLGKHLTLLQKQVVKCLWLMSGGNPASDDGGGAFVERFQQEARIAAEMTHQNLVRVTHVDRLGELHYLVMEYIDGEDVQRRVQRRGPMDERQALTTLLGASRGLGYAHARGIVHRDVKPANLMISTRGEVKVIDLGLARAIDTQRQGGATLGALGTPLFMAPEQWTSSNVGPTADVWALGATLHLLLTGRSHVPSTLASGDEIRRFVDEHEFPDPAGAGVQVRRRTLEVLHRCVARDPAARYPDARALAADLAELVDGDERVLIDPDCPRRADADEPDDDELRALQAQLANGDRDDAQGFDHTRVLAAPDATQPLPGVPAARAASAAAAAPPGPMTVPLRVDNTVRLRGDDKPSPHAADMPPLPAVPRRLPAPRRTVRAALAAALLTVAAGIGVAAWPRVDHAARQQQAMAAIYQERFGDADLLLVQLEQVPAYADQARRLRVDALVKDAARIAQADPVRALQRFDLAATVAARLAIPRDVEAAETRVRDERRPVEAAVRERIAKAVVVQSPLAGARVAKGRQPVVVHLRPDGLALAVSVQERGLTAGADGVWHGEWQAPDGDGAHELQLVVVETGSGVQHVVVVPVEVKRGAMALQITAPAQPSRVGDVELAATIDHGPVQVTCEVTCPDGSRTEHALGSRDGAFRFVMPARPDVDGEYRVQLRADDGENRVRSPVCPVTVDRKPPHLRVEPGVRYATGPVLLLQGTASEPCLVLAAGHEAQGVATDGALAFSLPVTLAAAEGEQAIVLDARDAAGNHHAAAVRLTVVVDRTPPQFIAGSVQHDLRTAAAELSVRGRLSEPGMIAAGDGAPVATDANGDFVVVAALPAGAIEQQFPCRLAANDLAGHPAPPQAIAVFIDRCGPRILPGAPDGSWSTGDAWQLRVEDGSGPCTVTLAGETRTTDADGRVQFARVDRSAPTVVMAADQLGNRSERVLAGVVGGSAIVAPAPPWGTPVAGSAIDARLQLYERVAVRIGAVDVVLRLVRPLRDDELPPGPARGAAVVPAPFYLAETELSVSAWQEFVSASGAKPASAGYQFDPRTCQWTAHAGADWHQPLHEKFADVATPEQRRQWPVTQVTPEAARAFCRHYGLRLPTESEWAYVVRFGSRHRYGWLPSGPLEERANFADLSLQAKAPGLAAFDPVDDGFAALAPVDALPQAGQQHPWGFRSLLGNVAEWCVTSRDRVVARGGSWLSEPLDLRVDDLGQDGLITTGAWDCVGLRVARDP